MLGFSKTRQLFILVLTGAVGLATPGLASDVSRANIVVTNPGGGVAATGQGQAGATYRVTARVPVACWVRPETAMLAQDGESGTVIEACNNPGGFTVTAAYRPLKTTESARMIYDNQTLDLAKSGMHLLRHSSIATIKRVTYQFQSVELDEPLVLSLTIQPI